MPVYLQLMVSLTMQLTFDQISDDVSSVNRKLGEAEYRRLFDTLFEKFKNPWLSAPYNQTLYVLIRESSGLSF